MREAAVDPSPPKITENCWVGAPHYLDKKKPKHVGDPGQNKIHHLKVVCLWNLFPFLALKGLVDLCFQGKPAQDEVCRGLMKFHTGHLLSFQA